MKFPLLLILFNRPDLTAGLLDIVRGQRGRIIYIAADGPRPDNPQDAPLCAEVQEMARDFSEHYDGECRLQFQSANLGCGPGVKAALDWFFNNEEAGIILEDDCHPNSDFFRFQDEMLEMHKLNERIFSVAGSSFLPVGLKPPAPIFLTKFTQIWGWGTWRRSWEKYQFQFQDEDVSTLEKLISSQFDSSAIAFYWKRELLNLQTRKIPYTWDIQLQFCCWREGGKNIAPACNLVTNCGFRGDATHTKEFSPRYEKPPEAFSGGEIGFNLPDYCEALDLLLFWTHTMGMNESRWKYLLLESDVEFSLRLQELSSLGDIYKMKQMVEWPKIIDLIHITARFFWNKAPGFLKSRS